ncbi:MAG TPA: 50S ribosomal protein L18 [Burkholderiales bacterium]|nr:50S ribosomal protein L18 [Burkholderiales bacterium]
MSDKKIARLRRARQTRLRIREVAAARLTVHRTNGHIYAQITTPTGDKVIAAASSLEKDGRSQLKHGGNRKAAELIGQRIAQKAKEKGIEQVAFDRAGYRYHGRV